jgi:flagellar basal-body rod protein FlgB
MLEKIGILNLATDKARHAAARQEVTARNMANADTPGYRARDVTEFKAEVDRGFTARRTHPAHFDFSAPRTEWREIDAGGAADPNGNSVSLDEEVLRSVQAERDHSRAITVYQASLGVLRAGLGRR